MSEFMTVMENWDGYRPVSEGGPNEAALARTLDLITNAARMPAHRHAYLLQEAITTSDFPVLLGGVLDRQMLALYRGAPSPWRSFVPTGTLRDFRVATVHKFQGNQQLLGLVREKEEYPSTPMTEGSYNRQLFKRGRMFDVSWEAIINDSMGAFDDNARRFSNAALFTEAWVATSIYAAAAGPNPLLFGAPIVDAADGQNVTNLGVLPLTIGNLQTTMQLMALQTDVQGRPLGIRAAHLVVPPQLEFAARAILTSAFVQQVDTTGGANAAAPTYVPLPTTNVLPQMGLQLHVDPMLPVVDASATADTTWYLFADASEGRWGQVDYLRGHEAPEICMKASNKVTLGGQLMDPFGGDFDTDNILMRVRLCIGGSPLDPRYAYAQQAP